MYYFFKNVPVLLKNKGEVGGCESKVHREDIN
jgi:hypothetical protein